MNCELRIADLGLASLKMGEEPGMRRIRNPKFAIQNSSYVQA